MWDWLFRRSKSEHLPAPTPFPRGEIAAFVRGYTRDLLPRVRYAGPIDPLGPRRLEHRHLQPKEDDPNLQFRNTVISFLFKSPPDAGNTASLASDALIHDLFVAHWEFAVAHDHGVWDRLATEALRRNLLGALAHAFALPLGMDQGLPLENAIGKHAFDTGISPIRHLLVELERLLARETRASARANLEKWRLHFQEKC